MTGFLSFIPLLLLSSMATLMGQQAQAAEIPAELREVQVTERLGETVGIQELKFRDEQGREVALSEYFQKGRPVLLTLVYYECPNLCNYLLNGLLSGLKPLDWIPGQQFEMVTVSINPNEKPALAAAKKKAYLKAYGKPEAESGWHFLTSMPTGDSDGDSARKLSRQVGFGYRYDEKEKQYAHSAALFLLTPEGRISRYLYGIDFKPKDIRLGLLEASSGKIGTVIDRILLFCYRYDPSKRGYSVVASKVMQASGAGTVVIFGGYLAVFWRRQRRQGQTGKQHGESSAQEISEKGV